jgi:hypothetical protein
MNWLINLFKSSPQTIGARRSGTKPTAQNVFVKQRGVYTVYDVDRMAQALGMDLRDIVSARWGHGSVESKIKKSVLSRGRGKGSMSAKDWGAGQ